MKIWVGFYDYGYDGNSTPSKVFLTEEDADKWQAGSKGMRDVVELEVDDDSNAVALGRTP